MAKQQQPIGDKPVVKAKRLYSPAKCRGCGGPGPSKRDGKFRYHDSCLENKPRSRQRWTGSEWEHLGVSSDAEARAS